MNRHTSYAQHAEPPSRPRINRNSRLKATFFTSIVATSAVFFSACTSIPADSVGTFDRAQNGTLVVGVSEHHPWTDVSDSGEFSGSEVDLIRGFADSINAEIEWHVAPESVLASQIQEGELDVVIGGLSKSAPWSKYMAFTRPYTTVEEEKMVMGTPLGENELLVALETHLAEEFGEI